MTTTDARDVRHPSARADCRECSGAGIVVVRDGERAVARACACVGVCPTCGGTGFVATADTFRAPRRRCDCQAAIARMRAFDAVGLPARHADSTRATFVASSRHQTAVLAAVTKYLNDWDRAGDNRGLVLWGDVGRGKTHLLVGLARELVFRHGASARFVEFSHLLADLKAGFDAGRGAAELLDPLVRVDVLAIDELGKGRNTEFETQVIDELVSRRYNAVRPILATTNYAPERATGAAVPSAAAVQLGTAAAPTLADRIGERVMSRLRETCDFVEVRGEDWRDHRGRRPRTPASRP